MRKTDDDSDDNKIPLRSRPHDHSLAQRHAVKLVEDFLEVSNHEITRLTVLFQINAEDERLELERTNARIFADSLSRMKSMLALGKINEAGKAFHILQAAEATGEQYYIDSIKSLQTFWSMPARLLEARLRGRAQVGDDGPRLSLEN